MGRHGGIESGVYGYLAREVTVELLEDGSHLSYEFELLEGLRKGEGIEGKRGLQVWLTLTLGGRVTAVHDGCAAHGAHGEVGHVGCAVLDQEFALEVVQDDAVEEDFIHVDIHGEVDVLGYYERARGLLPGVFSRRVGSVFGLLLGVGRGHEVVEVHVVALEVELSLEGLILEGEGHIVLESAVGRDVVLPDEHARLAQVEVAGREGKGRLLDGHFGKALDEHIHVPQVEGSAGLEAVILLLLDVGEAATEAHVGLDDAVQCDVLYGVYLFHLAEVECTLGGSGEVGVADRCLHLCRKGKGIAQHAQAESLKMDLRKVDVASGVGHACCDLYVVDACGQGGVAEVAVADLERGLKLG